MKIIIKSFTNGKSITFSALSLVIITIFPTNGTAAPPFLFQEPKMESVALKKMDNISADEIKMDNNFYRAAWSSDNRFFAAIGNPLRIVIFDAKNPDRRKELVIKESGTLHGSVAYSPDGRYLAGSVGVLSLWDANTLEWINDIEGPFSGGRSGYLAGAQGVGGIAFSPDSKSLVVHYTHFPMPDDAYNDNITAYNIESGDKIFSVNNQQKHSNITTNIAYSPDGRYFIAGRSWSVTATQQQETGEKFKHFTSIDFFDAKNGVIIKSISPVHVMRPTAVAISPDGLTIASGTTTLTKESVRNSRTGEWDFIDNHDPIKLWDTQSGKLLKEFGPVTGEVRSLVFSPDGTYLVSCQNDIQRETVAVWEIGTGKLLAKVRTPYTTYSSSGCSYSPDGGHIVIPIERVIYLLNAAAK